VLSVFAADRLTKAVVLKKLYLAKVEVFSFFSLRYVENTGIAFGMFQDMNLFFFLTNTALLVFLLAVRKKFPDPLSAAGIHFVIGGALGNIYDRVVYRFVVDFVDFSFFPAVFNVADAAITTGAVLIGASMVKEKVESVRDNSKTSKTSEKVKRMDNGK